MNIIEFFKKLFRKHEKSQGEIILSHLTSGRSLTSREAKDLYGCKHLRSRIHDLKTKGHKIKYVTIKENGVRVTQYSYPPIPPL